MLLENIMLWCLKLLFEGTAVLVAMGAFVCVLAFLALIIRSLAR